jgi:hypothetical protein
MHARAVDMAARFGMDMRVLSSFTEPGAPPRGTLITLEPTPMEEMVLTGIASAADFAKLVARGLPAGMETPTEMLGAPGGRGGERRHGGRGAGGGRARAPPAHAPRGGPPRGAAGGGGVAERLGGGGAGGADGALPHRAGGERDARPPGGVRPRLPRPPRRRGGGGGGLHLLDLHHPAGPLREGRTARSGRCTRASSWSERGPAETRGRTMHVALLGATGAVGRTMLRVLASAGSRWSA